MSRPDEDPAGDDEQLTRRTSVPAPRDERRPSQQGQPQQNPSWGQQGGPTQQPPQGWAPQRGRTQGPSWAPPGHQGQQPDPTQQGWGQPQQAPSWGQQDSPAQQPGPPPQGWAPQQGQQAPSWGQQGSPAQQPGPPQGWAPQQGQPQQGPSWAQQRHQGWQPDPTQQGWGQPDGGGTGNESGDLSSPDAGRSGGRGRVVRVVAIAAVVVALIAGGVVAALQLTAGPTLNNVAVQSAVERLAQDGYNATLSDISCPSGQDVTVGSTFDCTATASSGAEVRVPITILDEAGQYSVGRPQ